MRIAATLLGILAVGFAALGVQAEDAPPSDTSKSTVSQLNLGEYWWGAKINKEDLRGKVVLWETWGS